LDDKGQELQDLAVDELLRSGATRALATAMAETGAEVGELGVGEVAEGIGRLIKSEELEDQSELLEDAAEQLEEQGMDEVLASEELSEAAKEIRAEGVSEIEVGAEEVGEAETANAVAEGLK
jgi:predicted nucleic acid-binding protein